LNSNTDSNNANNKAGVLGGTIWAHIGHINFLNSNTDSNNANNIG